MGIKLHVSPTEKLVSVECFHNNLARVKVKDYKSRCKNRRLVDTKFFVLYTTCNLTNYHPFSLELIIFI